MICRRAPLRRTVIQAVELVNSDKCVRPEHDELVVQHVYDEHLRLHPNDLSEPVVQLCLARVEADLVVTVEDAVATCRGNFVS